MRTEGKVVHTENRELKIFQMVKEENNSNVLLQIFLEELLFLQTRAGR